MISPNKTIVFINEVTLNWLQSYKNQKNFIKSYFPKTLNEVTFN